MSQHTNLKVFGKHLRELRQSRGLSQEKMAELSGLHRTYYGGLERGERNPTLLTLIKISESIKINLIDLVDFNLRNDKQ
jgi:transcriptional regulator with XRE-family HTH domain